MFAYYIFKNCTVNHNSMIIKLLDYHNPLLKQLTGLTVAIIFHLYRDKCKIM